MRLSFTRIWVLLAVLTGALLPVGFMPDSSKAFAITICHGAETKTIFVDQNQAPLPQEDKQDSTCAFTPLSFAAQSFNPPMAIVIILALLFAGVLVLTAPTLAFSFSGGSNQQRAPPSPL